MYLPFLLRVIEKCGVLSAFRGPASSSGCKHQQQRVTLYPPFVRTVLQQVERGRQRASHNCRNVDCLTTACRHNLYAEEKGQVPKSGYSGCYHISWFILVGGGSDNSHVTSFFHSPANHLPQVIYTSGDPTPAMGVASWDCDGSCRKGKDFRYLSLF